MCELLFDLFKLNIVSKIYISFSISFLAEVLKTILRMAGTLPTSKIVSKKIIRKCASEICKIVPREGETDVILKTLLITAASFTIRQSVEIQDSKGIFYTF